MLGEKHAYAEEEGYSSRLSSSVGETATLVVLEQFQAIRDGDRFWYEREDMLTEDKLEEVKDLSLSDLLKVKFPELASEIPDDALQVMPSECL